MMPSFFELVQHAERQEAEAEAMTDLLITWCRGENYAKRFTQSQRVLGLMEEHINDYQGEPGQSDPATFARRLEYFAKDESAEIKAEAVAVFRAIVPFVRDWIWPKVRHARTDCLLSFRREMEEDAARQEQYKRAKQRDD
jgi:hypothetical protein